MRLVSLIEDTDNRGLIDAAKRHDFDLVSFTSISQFERFELNNATDTVVMVVDTIRASHLQFVERLMAFAPAPLIITATSIEPWQLSTLLHCGRVTYVPQPFDYSRLVKLMELALVRFKTANRLHSKVAELECRIEDEKRIQLAKLDLQQSGLSEQEAHKVIQKVSMDGGVRLPDCAAGLGKIVQGYFAHK